MRLPGWLSRASDLFSLAQTAKDLLASLGLLPWLISLGVAVIFGAWAHISALPPVWQGLLALSALVLGLFACNQWAQWWEKRRKSALLKLGGLVLALIVAAWWVSAVTPKLTIVARLPHRGSPFPVVFEVRSREVEVRDADMECILEHVLFERGHRLENVGGSSGKFFETIPRGGRHLISCPQPFFEGF